MQTIITYCLLYEKDGYLLEQSFVSIDEMRRFILGTGAHVVKTFKEAVMGSIEEITI